METWKNQLYFGDNLDILRGQHIPAESVDLIYLDPPFNSNATPSGTFKKAARQHKGRTPKDKQGELL
jgi:16S rRNA G966 N2-methylase RsmD